jgi:hypothetical protein
MRELKSAIVEKRAGVYSAINSVVRMPGPLERDHQDFGVQATYNFRGNARAVQPQPLRQRPKR